MDVNRSTIDVVALILNDPWLSYEIYGLQQLQ